jgi:hypothetical protein
VDSVEGPYGDGACTSSLVTFVDAGQSLVSAVLRDGQLVAFLEGDVRDALDDSEDDCIDGTFGQFGVGPVP